MREIIITLLLCATSNYSNLPKICIPTMAKMPIWHSGVSSIPYLTQKPQEACFCNTSSFLTHLSYLGPE
jgi:hypothetical protein